MYVDVDAVVGRLWSLSSSASSANTTQQHVYLGYQHQKTCVIRRPSCKWFDGKYPLAAKLPSQGGRRKGSWWLGKSCRTRYPTYAGGMFYILSSSLLSLLSTFNATGSGTFPTIDAGRNAESHSVGSSVGSSAGSSGILSLPLWSNEDSTVGTWVHDAFEALAKRKDGDGGGVIIHDANIWPSLLQEAGSEKDQTSIDGTFLLPPMVI